MVAAARNSEPHKLFFYPTGAPAGARQSDPPLRSPRALRLRNYTAKLAAHRIRPSMSRVGNPYNNAKAESFMKTLKQEAVDGRAYRNVAAARRSIARFLEEVYNRQRLHSALGCRPPVEFEAGLPP